MSAQQGSLGPPIADLCGDTNGDGDCPICVHGRWRCPLKWNIERRLNRHPDEVIARHQAIAADESFEYDQGDTILLDYDSYRDLVDVATELRKAAPNA